MNPETKIQTRIKKYLTGQGWLVLRCVNVQPFGTPDLLAIKDGTPLFIEVKTKSGRLSIKQACMMAKLYNYGAHVVLADNVGVVERYIEKYLNKNQT